MAKAKDVTRHVRSEVVRELWGRAAARCQFNGHNKLLYKHDVTQEPINLAEMAHIYSFAEKGPRGWGPLRKDRSGINDFKNLMLVCQGCHRLIDDDKEGKEYSGELLRGWKEAHEARVRMVTGILPSKRSHVVFYSTRVGEEHSPLNMGITYDAMFPEWYAADDRPIDLSPRFALDDSTLEFWAAEPAHLRKEFDLEVRRRIKDADPNHFSLFALAPQPLLIQLGALFTDKIEVEVYQPGREPKTWRRQAHPDGFSFVVNPPVEPSGPPAVLFSLSDKIDHERVHEATGTRAAIWEFTSTDPHNDFLKSEAQLSAFRTRVRKLFVDLRAAHPTAKEILIFPVMPVACAVELGRVRMPKADLPWVVFDQDKKQNAFVNRLTVGGTS